MEPASKPSDASSPANSVLPALLASLPCQCAKCAELQVDVALRRMPREAALRFLLGCDGDQAKAAHVLTSSLAWRVDFGVDELMAEPAEVFEARARAVQPYCPMGVHSRQSRWGHAVYILRVGYAIPSASRTANVFGSESGFEAGMRCGGTETRTSGKACLSPRDKPTYPLWQSPCRAVPFGRPRVV
jgi:hypothetical protein